MLDETCRRDSHLWTLGKLRTTILDELHKNGPDPTVPISLHVPDLVVGEPLLQDMKIGIDCGSSVLVSGIGGSSNRGNASSVSPF
ncbi:hypothetical protein BLNAU_8592 [Blattamonas nauphoetae]|uniref:Uncharacterized protein n=1 Tax=Blattamonas nauphoetae TaxID=2049346 RepID=A0ABQ9XYH6_9EUKA|nr:hypothetical protein BLNAU_8592 [Blattamonas nauphoetae]